MSTYYKRRKLASIPLSAMGDIAFLLLIFYMATTMITDQKPRDIDVPLVDNSPSQNSPYPIVIYMDQELANKGQVFLFNKNIPIESLAAVIQEHAVNAPQGASRFFINIERNLPYKRIHQVISALKDAGVSNLIITTRPTDS